MVGYWLVIAMMVCALIAVLVAAASASAPESDRPHRPDPPAPDTEHDPARVGRQRQPRPATKPGHRNRV